MPRSISNAASLRLASHQFHLSVFIVNCRLPESFDNVIVVTNGFITKECVGFNIDCSLDYQWRVRNYTIQYNTTVG